MDENRFWILASKKIAGDISMDETTELELLFIHNPDYRDIINNLAAAKNERPPLSPETEEKILKTLRSRIAAAEPPVSQNEETVTPGPVPQEEEEPAPGFWASYKYRIVLSSVILTLAVTAAFWIMSGKNTGNITATAPSENNIVTKPGSRSQIKLPDGTLVILNADSKLSYPDNFVGDTREVTLKGEAYFEVTENKSRPFIIHLEAMDIKVLGTVFNVKSYPGEFSSEASLIKGSIEITLKNRKNEKIMLKPHEKISVMTRPEAGDNKTVNNNISKQQKQEAMPLISVDQLDVDEKENIIKEIGWTQNKLMFRNEDLESIAIILQRWYGRPITVTSEKLKHQKFTGNFNNESLMQILQALQVSYNFSYKRENNSITIY